MRTERRTSRGKRRPSNEVRNQTLLRRQKKTKKTNPDMCTHVGGSRSQLLFTALYHAIVGRYLITAGLCFTLSSCQSRARTSQRHLEKVVMILDTDEVCFGERPTLKECKRAWCSHNSLIIHLKVLVLSSLPLNSHGCFPSESRKTCIRTGWNEIKKKGVVQN